MDCLGCKQPMTVRELHPLYEGGGITFKLEAAALAYVCEGCKLVSVQPPTFPPSDAAPVTGDAAAALPPPEQGAPAAT